MDSKVTQLVITALCLSIIFLVYNKHEYSMQGVFPNQNLLQRGVPQPSPGFQSRFSNRTKALKSPIYLISIPKCGSKLSKSMVDVMQRECGSHQKILPAHAFRNDAVHGFQRNSQLFLPETRIIFVVRDLKDALLSLANFYKKMIYPGPNLWGRLSRYLRYVLKPEPQLTQIINKWKGASLDDRLLWTIEDADNTIHRNGWFRFLINETIELINGHKEAEVFWYEDLVGSKGKGDDEIKRNRLNKLAQLLGTNHCDGVIGRLVKTSSNMKTLTMNRGQIGDSANVFNATHTKLFETLYANLAKQLGSSMISQMQSYDRKDLLGKQKITV